MALFCTSHSESKERFTWCVQAALLHSSTQAVSFAGFQAFPLELKLDVASPGSPACHLQTWRFLDFVIT